jgi:hypothetical protein
LEIGVGGDGGVVGRFIGKKLDVLLLLVLLLKLRLYVFKL